MKIELCEDNGFLSPDGKPSLVVLVVTGKDGRQLRIPYAAKNTIATLYKDIRNFFIEKDIDSVEDVVVNPFRVINDLKESDRQSDKDALASQWGDNIRKKFAEKDSKVIAREDIVQCVRLEKDLDGNVNPDISIGKKYRVIDIVKSAGVVTYYEVLDDEKDNKIRISVLPSEIELHRKFVRTAPARSQNFEIIEKCACGNEVSLSSSSVGKVYQGTCENCHIIITKPRELNDK
jgi:hypothetical protein